MTFAQGKTMASQCRIPTMASEHSRIQRQESTYRHDETARENIKQILASEYTLNAIASVQILETMASENRRTTRASACVMNAMASWSRTKAMACSI